MIGDVVTKLLDGKVALVTGAAGDVGRTIVARFAEEGAAVAGTDFNEAALHKALQKLEASGSKLMGLQHDVTSESDWRRVVAAVIALFGRLDILVNCAGAIRVVPVSYTHLDAADE